MYRTTITDKKKRALSNELLSQMSAHDASLTGMQFMQPLPWDRDAAGNGIFHAAASPGFSATNTHYRLYTASWQALPCTPFCYFSGLLGKSSKRLPNPSNLGSNHAHAISRAVA